MIDAENNIAGLAELRAARAAAEDYRDAFREMMSRGDGCMTGTRRPAESPAAVAVRYPVAVAYILAEGWSRASHHVKAAAGARAMDRIASGDDATEAVAEMTATWTAYCDARAWD